MSAQKLELRLRARSFIHRMTAWIHEGRCVLRYELLNRRRPLSIIPTYDVVVRREARFTEDELLAAIKAVSRPLRPRYAIWGIPFSYYEKPILLKAEDTELLLPVSHSGQGRIYAFLSRCHAELVKPP